MSASTNAHSVPNVERLERRRLLSAGDLDLTFGTGGAVAFDPTGPRVSSVSVLPDDRLLVVANSTADANLPYVLRRYTSAGQLDTTFGGGDGQVEFAVETNLPPGYSNTGASITPLSDGKLLVSASITQTVPGEDFIPTPYLERLNSDGTVDSTFGDGGVVKLSKSTFLNDLVIQGDGKILVLGTDAPTGEGPFILRRNGDGSVDTSFGGGDGIASLPGNTGAYPTQLQWQGDGKILAIGYLAEVGGAATFVDRLNSDGSTDTSFGNQGQARVDVPGITGVFPIDSVLLGNGKLRMGLAYEQVGPNGLSILGVNADGTPDTSFGENGLSVVGFGFERQGESVAHVQLDADGRLLVFGSANTSADVPVNGQIAVARVDAATGAIDESFGRVVLGDGYTVGFLPQGSSLQSDGAVILLAKALDPAVLPDVTHSELRRLLPDGTDPSPVALTNGTLSITGGAADDFVLAKPGDTTGGETPTTMASISGFGRVFDTADISLVSVLGNAGDDVVDLTRIALASTVSGGDGADRIAGGAGKDSLSGNAGKDRISGGGGNDRVAGNGGRDKLAGGAGNDRLYGGSSGDWLAGESGSDTLFGEGGNDRLSGGSGADELHGNAGDDSFFTAGDSTIDQLFGDRGHDVATADDDDVLHGIEVVTTG